MRFFAILLAAVALISLYSQADAQIYQYFDENGTLVITDTPPGHGNIRVIKPKTSNRPPSLKYLDDIRYEFYDVTGNNFIALVNQTNTLGPYDSEDGKRYPAQTRWKFGWSYKLEYTYTINGGKIYADVSVKSVDFDSDIVVVLPRITAGRSLAERDATLWDDYMRKLSDHEHEHVKIIRTPLYWDDAVSQVNSIKHLVIDYDQSLDIDSQIKASVEKETGRVGKNMVSRIKKVNDDFDDRTAHGMRQ